MGYTGFIKRIVKTIINSYEPKTVMDLGSQQDYDQPDLPAPYISPWYDAMGISYGCIDTNGENNAVVMDLGEFDPENVGANKYDLVVDAGTSEHVGRNASFSMEAIYNCWRHKHAMLETGGIMVNENPKSGNWPGHGFNYYTKEFYRALEAATDYHIILLDEHPAMENRIDGWNVVCIMQKNSDKFPTLEEFEQLGIQLS